MRWGELSLEISCVRQRQVTFFEWLKQWNQASVVVTADKVPATLLGPVSGRRNCKGSSILDYQYLDAGWLAGMKGVRERDCSDFDLDCIKDVCNLLPPWVFIFISFLAFIFIVCLCLYMCEMVRINMRCDFPSVSQTLCNDYPSRKCTSAAGSPRSFVCSHRCPSATSNFSLMRSLVGFFSWWLFSSDLAVTQNYLMLILVF